MDPTGEKKYGTGFFLELAACAAVGGDTGFSEVRKQGPNRPLVVPWDHKRRGVRFIGANSGVVTAHAGSSMLKKLHRGDIAARGPWARPSEQETRGF